MGLLKKLCSYFLLDENAINSPLKLKKDTKLKLPKLSGYQEYEPMDKPLCEDMFKDTRNPIYEYRIRNIYNEPYDMFKDN